MAAFPVALGVIWGVRFQSSGLRYLGIHMSQAFWHIACGLVIKDYSGLPLLSARWVGGHRHLTTRQSPWVWLFSFLFFTTLGGVLDG